MKAFIATKEKALLQFIKSKPWNLFLSMDFPDLDMLNSALRQQQPEILILTDDWFGPKSQQDIIEDILEFRKITPGCRILLLSQTPIQNSIKSRMEANLIWCLPAPVTQKKITDWIYEQINSLKANQIPKAFALWSPKGGSGTTMTALHLAKAFGEQGLKIAMVDADMKTNGASFWLGIDNEGWDQAYPLISASALDNRLLAGMGQEKEGFWIFGGSGRPNMPSPWNNLQIAAISKMINQTKDAVVYDAGRGLEQTTTRTILAEADQILAVIEPTLLSLHLLEAALAQFADYNINTRKVSIILNRYSYQLYGDDFQAYVKSIQLKALAALPDMGSESLRLQGLKILCDEQPSHKDATAIYRGELKALATRLRTQEQQNKTEAQEVRSENRRGLFGGW